MTLATHAVVGAAIAATMPDHPAIGFGLGFVSHFVLDALPHWDYQLRSAKFDNDHPLENDMVIGRDFCFDLCKIGFDALLGLTVGYLFFRHGLWGAVGAMLPDFLQFVYFKTRSRFVGLVQQFHSWAHTTHRLDNRPIYGVLLQLLLVSAIVIISL